MRKNYLQFRIIYDEKPDDPDNTKKNIRCLFSKRHLKDLCLNVCLEGGGDHYE